MRKLIFVGAMLIGMVTNSFGLVFQKGITSSVTTVNGQDTDKFQESFVGGYQASVLISGDHDTDLDLYVYDQNGNLVCQSVSNGDDEVCTWNPLWTGPFLIKVKNRGYVYNRYTIIAQ